MVESVMMSRTMSQESLPLRRTIVGKEPPNERTQVARKEAVERKLLQEASQTVWSSRNATSGLKSAVLAGSTNNVYASGERRSKLTNVGPALGKPKA
jgi:hypothetical protein